MGWGHPSQYCTAMMASLSLPALDSVPVLRLLNII